MKKAFSIIEMLVVIGIIALITAIVLPVIGKTREAARVVVCNERLRQIGVALCNYRSEDKHDAIIPTSIVFQMQTAGYWPLALEGRLPKDILYCPSFDENASSMSSYMINWNLWTERGRPRWTELRSSEIVLMGENVPYSGYLTSFRGEDLDVCFGWRRHGVRRGASLLWLDYHVSMSGQSSEKDVRRAWDYIRWLQPS